MLAGNQNNKLGNTLQDFDQLPEGFGFSSDAVWNELEATLLQQKKQGRFLNMRQYLVAVSLLLFVSITVIYLLTIKSNSVKLEAVSTNLPTFQKALTESKNIFAPYTPLGKRELFEKSILHKKLQPETRLAGVPVNSEIVLTEEAPIIQIAAAQTITDSITTNVIEQKKIGQKKRLPIIHINELNAPPDPVYTKSNNRKVYLDEPEEITIPSEYPKPWWQPKPKSVSPIISITDNQ